MTRDLLTIAAQQRSVDVVLVEADEIEEADHGPQAAEDAPDKGHDAGHDDAWKAIAVVSDQDAVVW